MKQWALATAITLTACASTPDRAADHAYVEAQTKDLAPGMELEKVKAHFDALGRPMEVYNTCKKDFEWPLSPCNAGYSAMGIFQLPSARGTTRHDQAQVYLSFDAKRTLTDYAFELYYEGEH